MWDPEILWAPEPEGPEVSERWVSEIVGLKVPEVLETLYVLGHLEL